MTEFVTLRFWAAVHSIHTEGERLATFYLMNTSLNLNNWAVTDGALEEALPTLLGKPVGCVPGYRVNHVHEPLVVGRWVKVEKPDGYALATAEITDAAAWERITGGEWGPVSVVIRAFKVTCSLCLADITDEPDEHVRSGAAHEVVESFVFDRVDFVSEPAYPQAGLISVGDAVLGASRSGDGGRVGAPSGGSKPTEDDGLDKVEELGRMVEALKTENEGLRETVKRVEAERHQVKVTRALEAREKAGLVKDRKTEEDRLRGLGDETLELLTEDAEQVASRTVKASAQPRAKFTGEGGDLEAAMEETRLRLFGHRRDST